jgi:hypothetical protein
MKLILSRYFLYSFIALEVLILPILLPEELYVEVEYYRFILFMLPFLMLGPHSGYVYYKYTKHRDYFSSLLVFGMFHFLIVSLIVYLYSDDFLFSLSALFVVIFMIFEQKLQTEKMYILALSPKPFISIVLIVLSILYHFKILATESLNLLYYSIFIAFCIWIFTALVRLTNKYDNKLKVKFNYYLQLIKKGFFINAGSLLLMALFFTDRYFTKEYYGDYLTSYSFSYNLVQFVILALSTIAYVQVVEIGESISKINAHLIKEKLKYSYKVFLILYFLFTVFIYSLSSYYNFVDFAIISLTMGFLLGNYFTINSIGSISLYLDFQKQMVFILGCIVVSNLILSYVFVTLSFDYIYLIVKSGVLLNIVSLYFLKKIYDEFKVIGIQ